MCYLVSMEIPNEIEGLVGCNTVDILNPIKNVLMSDLIFFHYKRNKKRAFLNFIVSNLFLNR